MWKTLLASIYLTITASSSEALPCGPPDFWSRALEHHGQETLVGEGVLDNGLLQFFTGQGGGWIIIATFAVPAEIPQRNPQNTRRVSCLLFAGSDWTKIELAHEYVAEYEVALGDSLWRLIERHAQPNLAGLSKEQRDAVVRILTEKMQTLISRISKRERRLFGFRRDDIGLLFPGDRVDLGPLFHTPIILGEAIRQAVELLPSTSNFIEMNPHATEVGCIPNLTLEAELAQTYQQTKVFEGSVSWSKPLRATIELYASVLNDEWTLIVRDFAGHICAAVHGDGWNSTRIPLGPMS